MWERVHNNDEMIIVYFLALLQVGQRQENAEPRNELLLGIHTILVSFHDIYIFYYEPRENKRHARPARVL